jgi:hypothetical protein
VAQPPRMLGRIKIASFIVILRIVTTADKMRTIV